MIKIYVEEKIPKAIVKPNNWITKLFWKFIKLDINIVMIENPIITAMRPTNTSLWDLFPKQKYIERKYNIIRGKNVDSKRKISKNVK